MLIKKAVCLLNKSIFCIIYLRTCLSKENILLFKCQNGNWMVDQALTIHFQTLDPNCPTRNEIYERISVTTGFPNQSWRNFRREKSRRFRSNMRSNIVSEVPNFLYSNVLYAIIQMSTPGFRNFLGLCEFKP